MNKNVGKLADEYGIVKAAIAELQEKMDTLRNMILETGLDRINGELFKVSVCDVEKETFSVGMLKVEMPDVYKKFCRKTNQTVVRCNAR